MDITTFSTCIRYNLFLHNHCNLSPPTLSLLLRLSSNTARGTRHHYTFTVDDTSRDRSLPSGTAHQSRLVQTRKSPKGRKGTHLGVTGCYHRVLTRIFICSVIATAQSLDSHISLQVSPATYFGGIFYSTVCQGGHHHHGRLLDMGFRFPLTFPSYFLRWERRCTGVISNSFIRWS